MNESKISNKIPKSDSTTEYIKQIREENEKERHIYVPYGTEYADKTKVNCYMKDKVNELVIEYQVPRRNISRSDQKDKIDYCRKTSCIR